MTIQFNDNIKQNNNTLLLNRKKKGGIPLICAVHMHVDVYYCMCVRYYCMQTSDVTVFDLKWAMFQSASLDCVIVYLDVRGTGCRGHE